MAAYQYCTITDAINHFHSYYAHLKKLEEIKQGKHKTLRQRSQFIDPKLEESKISIYKHKLVNRHFLEKEKKIGILRETRSLINILQEIEKGKHSSLPEKKNAVQCSSACTLNEPFKKKEERRLKIENKKMLQRLIGARAQCNTQKIIQDYRKSIAYQKRMQKSNKNWETITQGMRAECHANRLPPINSVKHNLPKSQRVNAPNSQSIIQEKLLEKQVEKPKESKKNFLSESPASHNPSCSIQPEKKTQKFNKEEKFIYSSFTEEKSKSPPVNSSPNPDPVLHSLKPEQNPSLPQEESSPTAKQAKKEEDIGIEELADFIHEDFETQSTFIFSNQLQQTNKQKFNIIF